MYFKNPSSQITPLTDSSKDITKPRPSAVEIYGVKSSTEMMTVQYYFESKNGVDEDVTSIEYLKEKDVYIIIFGSEDGNFFTAI